MCWIWNKTLKLTNHYSCQYTETGVPHIIPWTVSVQWKAIWNICREDVEFLHAINDYIIINYKIAHSNPKCCVSHKYCYNIMVEVTMANLWR